MENQTQQSNARAVFFTEGRMLLAVFLGGVALILWYVNSSITPIARLQSDLVNLRDNHIHTLQGDMDEVKKGVRDLEQQMVRINTLLEERLPAKK
jgi:hypothetical protein